MTQEKQQAKADAQALKLSQQTNKADKVPVDRGRAVQKQVASSSRKPKSNRIEVSSKVSKINRSRRIPLQDITNTQQF